MDKAQRQYRSGILKCDEDGRFPRHMSARHGRNGLKSHHPTLDLDSEWLSILSILVSNSPAGKRWLVSTYLNNTWTTSVFAKHISINKRFPSCPPRDITDNGYEIKCAACRQWRSGDNGSLQPWDWRIGYCHCCVKVKLQSCIRKWIHNHFGRPWWHQRLEANKQ